MTPRQAAHVPGASYRLQLNAGFTFRDAREAVAYLDRLGVTDLYLSPVFAVRSGSAHGYDIVDPTRVSPVLGGRRGLERLAGELRRRGMCLLLDIVPNHMAASPENTWWRDVLRRGRRSPYAHVFDIDWARSRDGGLTYRRFFDIDDLAGVRVEDPLVFEATHHLIFDLLDARIATGVRIDHIDGLHDPLAYLRRLRRRAGAETYVVVEKILTGDEPLPREWPVAGTTGYDFTNTVGGLFVHRDGLAALGEAYRRFTGEAASLPEAVYESKRRVLHELFAREIDALASDLCAVAARDAPALRLLDEEARDALEEVIARLPVYRTYIRDAPVSSRDRAYIERALREARERVRPAVLASLRRLLLLRFPSRLPVRRRRAWLRYVMRWQQLTGAATAKGVEDTALYLYNRLLSLNEVGVDPNAPGPLALDAFHARMRRRLARWPYTMNATATHDTKRGEDARMRIAALSELPDEWPRALRRWRRANRALKTRIGRRLAPDANEEWLLYQALLGAWPLEERELPEFRRRFEQYVTKALREAKRHTSWRAPDAAYERAVIQFVRGALRNDAFLRDFLPFQQRLAFHGAVNSLAQLTIKTGAPGLPDMYQGIELWDLSLVDPDNRRPVDLALRSRLLEEIDRRASRDRPALVRELLAGWEDGRIKLYVTAQALRFRRERRELFANGEYVPLYASGPARDHVVAFARRASSQWAFVAAPRLVAAMTTAGRFPTGDVWGADAIRLPRGAPSDWRDALTGERVVATRSRLALREIFAHLPVALLAGEG